MNDKPISHESVGDENEVQEGEAEPEVNTILSNVVGTIRKPEQLQDLMHAVSSATKDQSEPAKMKEAFSCSEFEKWKDAAREEYASLIKNKT